MVKNAKNSGLSEVWWLARGNELWSYTICFGGTGGINNIHDANEREFLGFDLQQFLWKASFKS